MRIGIVCLRLAYVVFIDESLPVGRQVIHSRVIDK